MKKIAFYFWILSITSLIGCKQENTQTNTPTDAYFNLKSFFEMEAIILNKQNPFVIKSVAKNETSETKKIKVKNWKKEFQSFIDADINKASWQNEFKITTENETTTYTTENVKISVKKLIVVKKGKSVILIKAFVTDSNFLYTSKDTLTYYPSISYEIKKSQKIKFFSEISYKIIGKFE